MKKNYFLSFVMLLCFMTLAVKANAQAEGMTDLYGKWAFTATVETTALAADYEGRFAAESEVVITKESNGYFEAEISGFAGGSGTFYPQKFDAATQILHILNAPNVWGSGLSMSFAEGGYPYATENFYGELEWTYDDATKTLTIPDFTIVANLDHSAETAEIVAKFTNCKMVQTEAENVEIPNIAGEYNFEPDMNYVRNDSTFTYNFSVSLAATDESNASYDATVTFDGYEPFFLSATFDGMRLTINYEDVWFDVEKKHFLGVQSPAAGKKGALTFNYVSEKALMLWDAIYVRQDSVPVETEVTDEETGEVRIEVKYSFPILQKLSSGFLVRESEATQGFTWVGTYNVSSDTIVANKELAAQFGEWPTEFNIVIEEKMPGSFYVTEIAGCDVYSPNNGYTIIKPADDNKSATIDLAQFYGMFLLQSLGNGEYLQIFDGNNTTGTITLTLNEDGTISISPMFIQKTAWGADPSTFQPVIFYQNMTAVKEVKKFDWFDTFTLTADVESLNGTEYPSTFLVRFGDVELYGATYSSMVAEFFGYDNLTANNYGGNALTVAEDTQSATMPAGIYAGGKYPNYFKIYDINGTTSALNFVVNEDGSISMDDFIITTYDNNPDDWSAPAVETNAAKYTNVVLTRGDTTGINSVVEEVAPVVEGIYDLMGRKYDAITAPGIYIVNGKKVVK
ncbi:MAG: hypothetical protein IJ436_03520 [Bacteroidaceae bacterium]|nr:hypothetical protein [Bacteroidaceae bacterium]